MPVVMYGKQPAEHIKNYIKNKISLIGEQLVSPPVLGVVVVGHDPASAAYVRGKEKDCAECGILCHVYRYENDVSENDLIQFITELSNSNLVNGIIVQLPLPSHINERKIINCIAPMRDVDCFNPINVGKMMIDSSGFLPCTPAGVIEILKFYGVEIEGKNCVVIGRSNIVGKPMAHLLTQENGTVTLCHSKTRDIASYTRNADIIVCAVGKKNFLTADMVKDGVVVVDVGINRDENNHLCGDVDYENVAPKCSYITPVPGGVGLMTRAVLMANVYKAWKAQNNLNFLKFGT